MTTIKPIEAHSVHQIQSGQVIVDLCSVVKELVENSLDAGATTLEVRFKNNGLDSIEVQDNGSGIAPSNYENLALKHYTSKLTSYDDLSSLHTFGFRGEALSSLCALSTFFVITALADEAPKGTRLDFESSGRLKSAVVVAAQRGTTVVVEGLFDPLPVRRKELTKNIKKEYGKVLGLLHAYACVGTNVKFTVKSSMAKGKNAIVFATKGNPTTKENIANVYGAKTLSALVPLNLQLEFQRTILDKKEVDSKDNEMIVQGHVSRPIFGEGRQTPDRQMFFVNGRPCGLPQVAKAFNEVYKSFNVSQSPFIFADLKMDTNAYDVNVSPDKRTIMLHDSVALVETLKSSLTELFDEQEQTMPQSQVQTSRLPAYKQLTIARDLTIDSTDTNQSDEVLRTSNNNSTRDENDGRNSVLHDFFRGQASTRQEPKAVVSEVATSKSMQKLAKIIEAEANHARQHDERDAVVLMQDFDEDSNTRRTEQAKDVRVRDFNMRMVEEQPRATKPSSILKDHEADMSSAPSPPRSSVIQEALNHVRPNRPAAEIATITVGDKTITTMTGTSARTLRTTKAKSEDASLEVRFAVPASTQAFTQRLKGFAALGASNAGLSVADSIRLESVYEPGKSSPVSDGSVEDEAGDLSPISADSGKAQGFGGGSQEADSPGESNGDFEIESEGSTGSPRSEADEEYIDESEKKAREDLLVAELIRAAEEKATSLSVDNTKRANRVLKSAPRKDSTAGLQLTVAKSIEQIQNLANNKPRSSKRIENRSIMPEEGHGVREIENEEERLALTVSKTDFSNMLVVGQFNQGFILAVRTSSDASVTESETRNTDELFIIDQHASDEKFNFERLQAETVVGNQRLVRSKQLDLTAVEEEVLIENLSALEKNGFVVYVDTTGEEPIGQRCRLVSLPLSKEVIFGLEDLEELLHLLAESPAPCQSLVVPRPSKVRKMFAMRACRSSIMIGRTLTETKMRAVVSHMGEIDKPWNCPHGRPTMRHLMTISSFETWQEGDGIGTGQPGVTEDINIWKRYVK